MDKKDFLRKIAQMTLDEINEYIKDKGKKKVPESYHVPFSYKFGQDENNNNLQWP